MFELEDYRCPNRSCPGVWRDGNRYPAMLEYVKLHDFYQCPECGCEVWEPMDRGDGKVTGREARAAFREEIKYKNAIRVHGGGSRKAGRRRQKPPKFYPPWLPE